MNEENKGCGGLLLLFFGLLTLISVLGKMTDLDKRLTRTEAEYQQLRYKVERAEFDKLMEANRQKIALENRNE